MRRLLFLLFAPLTLFGGLVVGYFSYPIREAYIAAASQPEVGFDWLSSMMSVNWLLYVGLVAIVIGAYVRHRTLTAFERDIRAEKEAHSEDNQRLAETSVELLAAKRQLDVVRDFLLQMPEEVKEEIILNGDK